MNEKVKTMDYGFGIGKDHLILKIIAFFLYINFLPTFWS